MASKADSAEQVSTPANVVVAPPQPAGRVYLRPEHLYKAIGLFFLLAFFYRFFDQLAQGLLLLYAAVIFAILLNHLGRKLPLHRKWIAALAGLVVLGAIGAAFWFGVPALVGQLRDIAARGPEFEAQLHALEDWLRINLGVNVELVGPRAQQTMRRVFTGSGINLVGTAQSVLGVILVPLLILFGGLFAVANPNNRLLNPVLRVVPRTSRLAWRRIFELMGVRIIGWLKGVLIGMVVVGLMSWLLFWIIGVPNALLLGVISALTEAVPLLGPWIGGTIATAVAFLDDPNKAAWAALAALAIQQFENNILIPWAMSETADIHPFVTLFALVFFGSLFGFLGVVLSIPLVILIWTLIEVLWVERALDTDEDRIAPIVTE